MSDSTSGPRLALVLGALLAAGGLGACAPSDGEPVVVEVPIPVKKAWQQFGGPDRDFTVDQTPPLAESWPADGPVEVWRRPLGHGHSAILFDRDRLFTMYRQADSMADSAEPKFSEREVIVALDAASGDTLWEFDYPSKVQDFGRGAGPHATPLVVGDRLFAVGTNKRLHALETATGSLLWEVDFVEDLGAPPLLIRPMVKSGYASSPVAYGDLLLCFVGGPGQSVIAFDQATGSVVWRSGDFLISGASPIIASVDGQDQAIFFAGSLAAGLDPSTGTVLWAHAHDAGNDFNLTQPVWGDDQILFLSSAYRAGSRAVRLRQTGGVTSVEELWFEPRIKFQFLNAVRVGSVVYGTTGQSGTAFLTAVDVETGKEHWRERGFGQSTLLHADDKLFVLTEDGELAVTRASAEGLQVLARAQIFDGRSWTVPTLVDRRLFARDRETIVALDVGADVVVVKGERVPVDGS